VQILTVTVPCLPSIKTKRYSELVATCIVITLRLRLSVTVCLRILKNGLIFTVLTTYEVFVLVDYNVNKSRQRPDTSAKESLLWIRKPYPVPDSGSGLSPKFNGAFVVQGHICEKMFMKIRSLFSCGDISQTVEKCRTNVEESFKKLLDPHAKFNQFFLDQIHSS